MLPQIVPSETCLRCDVCCRFPEQDSFLRPYFTKEEIARAVARGIDRKHFSDPNGGQIAVVPNPSGEGFLCPAFDPATSHCRIYEDRPLDCRIYPLAIMRSADGRDVVLGWDAKCPFMRDAGPAAIEAHAETIFALLEQDETVTLLAKNPRLIGRFQDDVVILKALPKLTARLGHETRDAGRETNQEGGASGLDARGSQLAAATHPFTLADRARFEQACALVDTPLAHYAVAPHLIWKDLFRYSWTEIDGRFCIFADYADGIYMPLPPLPGDVKREASGVKREQDGIKPSKKAFEAAFAYMRERNKSSAVSRIENVPEEWKAILEGWGYCVQPKDPDYLYRTADLVALAGDRYKSQRAACNRFEREHGAKLAPYEDRDREACLALFQDWSRQKETAGLSESGRLMLADSEAAHREALTHHRELGLSGWVVTIGGQVRAYTFGYARSRSVWCVLLEVADRSVHGLAEWIFRAGCREAAGRGCEFVNTMDDSGLPALAQSKQAYHPVRMVPSYIVEPSA